MLYCTQPQVHQGCISVAIHAFKILRVSCAIFTDCTRIHGLLLRLQAVELLSRQADTPVREKDFIKAVPDMDMINAFVGTVKLSMPGLVKIKQDVRKNKKKK